MRFLFFILIAALAMSAAPSHLLAEPGSDDVNTKIEALQEQVSGLQGQISELKQQLATQSAQSSKLQDKVQTQEVKMKEGFRLKEAMGMEESKLNIGGEINMRYRENMDKDGADPGFQLYEVELFLDSAVNPNGSFFVELPIMHSNKPDLGNTWIDFHKEGELAATGSTGLMIGHFMPWFGYYGYDDNQSWIYGGRTTTNTALVRNQSVDSQIMRDRQVGIGANLALGPVLSTTQVFNGAGPYTVSGGTDNDQRKDVVQRLQYTLPNELGVFGAGAWWAPKTRGATSNSAGSTYGSGGKKHVRDIERYVVFAKYPDVMQATLPDLSLGGKPFVVYGEYHWGKFHGNPSISTANNTQDYEGAWVETNVNIIRDKLVGLFRWDWFDPDADPNQDVDHIWGLTPGFKWQFLNQMYLTTTYEFYDGNAQASGKDNDRITLELSTQF